MRCTGSTSRTLEAMNASSAAARSSSVVGSSRARVGADQQSLVEAPLAGASRSEHVGCVRQRLDTVQHQRGRVGDAPERDALGQRGQRLQQRDAVPAAGDEHPHQPVPRLRGRQQRPHVLLHGGAVELEQQVGGRALHALEVLAERERAPGIQTHHLEHAVAAQEAFVGHRDARLRARHQLAIQTREHALDGAGISEELALHGSSFKQRAQPAAWARGRFGARSAASPGASRGGG